MRWVYRAFLLLVLSTRVCAEVDISAEKQMLESALLKEFLRTKHVPRAGSCPLRNKTPLQIVDQLKRVETGLRKGKCEEDQQASLDGIKKMAKELETIHETNQRLSRGDFNNYNGGAGTLGDLNADPNSYTAANQGVIDGTGVATQPAGAAPANQQQQALQRSQILLRSQHVVSNLAQMAHSSECGEELTRRGLISQVADVATNIGLLALVVPSPNGVAIGTGAIGTGAILHILVALFRSPFDWNLESHRRAFLDLNCSFFDLRRELEAGQFFEIPDNHLEARLHEGKELASQLALLLEGLQKKRDDYYKTLSSDQREFLADKWGGEVLTWSDHVAKLKSLIDESYTNGWSPADFLLRAIPLIPEVKVGLEKGYREFEFNSHLLKVLEKITHDNFDALVALAGGLFEATIRKPMSHFIWKIDGHFDRERATDLVAFIPGEQDKKKRGEFEKELADTLAKLEKRLDEVKHLVLIMSSSGASRLSAEDESGHVSYDIISEYNRIRSMIFGKRGWSYLKFMLGQAEEFHGTFKSRYGKWVEDYHEITGQLKGDIAWACRDAQQARLAWDQSNAAVETSYDFLAANFGIISTDVDLLRYYFGFFPVGHSYGYKIVHNAIAAELAKKHLAGDKKVTRKMIKKQRWRQNLGLLALQHEDTQRIRQDLEKFIDRHQCKKFL